MSDIIAKEKIYSKYENIEQTLVHPETQVAQIVDFREGVIAALPEDVVYKGDNVSLLNNDAGYINNIEATAIANTEVSNYTYDKPTIDGKADALRNQIDSLLHEKDGKIQELKDKLDDTYARLKEYMDTKDFLNLAPKLGYYQEDEMQAVSKYNINNIENRFRIAPVITTDNTGKEVMYFVANNGGPDRETNEGLHKAYKINETSGWVYYNTIIIPYCLKSEINAGGKIRAIFGCDNDYLVVQFLTSTNVTKWYLIFTNFSFDENEWKTKIDVSDMIIHTQTTNPKPDTAELLMHVKYIKDYNVFVTFTAISSTYTDKYWYRMRVYNFYATSSSAQHTLLRTPIDLEGWSNVVDAGSNYSWALDMDITNPLADSFIKPKTSTSAATDTRAQDVINKYGSSYLRNALYMGTTENNSLAGQIVYLHEQEVLVITLVRLLNDIMCYKEGGYCKSWVEFGAGNGNNAIVFKVPKNIIITKNNTLKPTLKTSPNSYNATDGYQSKAFEELTALGPYGLNANGNGFARRLTHRCNNSSYDSYNGKAYYTRYDPADKLWSYNRLLDSAQNINSNKWAGLMTEKDYGNFRITDASDWGKAITNGGIIMWDKIVLPCTSQKNNGNRLVWIKKWQFIENHANDLYVEPVAGEHRIVSANNTINVLANATSFGTAKTDVNSKMMPITDNYYKADYTPSKAPIISCRMANGDPRYFHAEFVRNSDDTSLTSITGKIDLYEFFDDTYTDDDGNEDFRIRFNKNTIVDNITINKSDFNLTNGSYSSDAQYVEINKYSCIYNPMAFSGTGVFLLGATLEKGSTSNPNFKYINFVAIKPDGTINRFTAPAGSLFDTAFTSMSSIRNDYINRKSFRRFYIMSAMCINANSILVGINMRTNTGEGPYNVLFTFNSNYTAITDCKFINANSTGGGIQYGTSTYYTHMYLYNVLHYGGKKLGICGLGIVAGDEINYFATYHTNIRTQNPLIGTNSNEKTYSTAQIDANLFGANYEYDKSYKDPTKINVYTMWLQASSGLICYIPSGPIFLGGYYSVINTPISVSLSANLRTKFIGQSKTLKINPSTSSSKYGIDKKDLETITVNVSENNYDANYIYLKRDPDDRDNIIAYASPQRIIFDGARQFNLILVAKVETDAEKCIKMTYYRVNTGYNDYSF